MRLLGRGFYTLIKNVSFSSPTDVESHNPPPFGTQRLRCHSFLSPIDMRSHDPPLLWLNVLTCTSPCVYPRSGFRLLASTSNTICNNSSPLVTDPPLPWLNVLTCTSPCVHPRSGFRLLASTSNTICNNSSPLVTDPPLSWLNVLTCTSPCVHPPSGFSLLTSTSNTICNNSSPLVTDIIRFGPLRMLGRGLHTLIRNVSFSSPTVVRSHNTPVQKDHTQLLC